MLLLQACSNDGGKKTVDSGSESAADKKSTSIQYVSDNSSMNGNILLSSMGNLMFQDENGNTRFVCSKPGCLHDGNDDCTAIKYGGSYYPLLYDGKVYVICQENSEESRSFCLYSMEENGSDLKKLYDFGEEKAYSIGNFSAIRIDNNYYFGMCSQKKETHEDGYDETAEAYGFIYELNLDDDSVRRIFESEKSHSTVLFNFYYCSNRLIADYNIQKKSLLEAGYTYSEMLKVFSGGSTEDYEKLYDALGKTDYVTIINPEKNEKLILSPNWYICAAHNGQLIAEPKRKLNSEPDYKYLLFDPETQAESDASLYNGYILTNTADGVLLKKPYIEGNSLEYCYLKEGQKEVEIHNKDDDIYIMGESEDYFYVAFSKSGVFYKYEMIKKDEF